MVAYDFTVKDQKNNDVCLDLYKDKVLLIVNTATGCGFTPQYKGLQELYDAHQHQGFEILDFPCNQFMNQAPGSDAEITNFCTLNYGTTFPRFHKVEVNGKDAAPLFLWLKAQKGGLLDGSIKWNFTKFLIDKNGNVVNRYAPTTKPEDIEADIVKLLT